jgi:hypothetical protein
LLHDGGFGGCVLVVDWLLVLCSLCFLFVCPVLSYSVLSLTRLYHC